MDLGTCRKKDLFITDSDYKEVPGFKTLKVFFNNENIDCNNLYEEFNNDIDKEEEEETKIDTPKSFSSFF